MSWKNLKLVDSETGEEVIVSAEDWAALHKLVDNPDDVLASLSNSGDPDMQKFFDGLITQLVAAIDKDTHVAARTASDHADKELGSRRSAFAQALEDTLAKIDGLSPREKMLAKSMGELYLRPELREKVNKAILREPGFLDADAAGEASLMEAIESNARRTFNKNTINLI